MSDDDRTEPVPPLCERCWSAILPDEPGRRVETREGRAGVVLVGFVHADLACPPQVADDDQAV